MTISAETLDWLERCFARALRYFRKKGLSQPDAEDCAAEVRLQILHCLQRGATLSDGYFLAVLRGCYADFVAHCTNQPPILPSEHATSAEEGEPYLTVQVRCAIERLDHADRELLLLHDVAGYTLAELAAHFACSPDCLRQRLHRARARLRRLLE